MRVSGCVGAYLYGNLGSNRCPPNSVKILTEAACRIATAAAGKSINEHTFVETVPYNPSGCNWGGAYGMSFNTHAVGAGDSSRKPLCAATRCPDCTSAPTGMPARVPQVVLRALLGKLDRHL